MFTETDRMVGPEDEGAMIEEVKKPKNVTAGLLIIGEEILSGRTKDENTSYIAAQLTGVGIALREVRVVADSESVIAAAVNALRTTYRYVFTTGGIGPTHDDVTTDAIGKAFGVPVELSEAAVAAMRLQYTEEQLTPARLRMARIPQGATLIHNPVSRAPGYMLENVIVMAGVPRIMQVMLDDVMPRLDKGSPLKVRTVRVDAPEGDVAPPLSALQADHPSVQIGSYPFFEQTRFGTYVVLRARSPAEVDAACEALWARLTEQGFQLVAGEPGEAP